MYMHCSFYKKSPAKESTNQIKQNNGMSIYVFHRLISLVINISQGMAYLLKWRVCDRYI